MSYSKPKILAENKAQGSFAAGCPAKDMGYDSTCRRCDRAK